MRCEGVQQITRNEIALDDRLKGRPADVPTALGGTKPWKPHDHKRVEDHYGKKIQKEEIRLRKNKKNIIEPCKLKNKKKQT